MGCKIPTLLLIAEKFYTGELDRNTGTEKVMYVIHAI